MGSMTTTPPAVKPRRPRAEVLRVADMRRQVRLADEVWVWAVTIGFVRVGKAEARKLIRKLGGDLVGRWEPGLGILMIEPCPF